MISYRSSVTTGGYLIKTKLTSFIPDYSIVLNCFCSRTCKDHLLLILCYYRKRSTETKLTLFILDSSISSKLFSIKFTSVYKDHVVFIQCY